MPKVGEPPNDGREGVPPKTGEPPKPPGGGLPKTVGADVGEPKPLWATLCPAPELKGPACVLDARSK